MKTTILALATSMAALLFVSPPAAAAEAAHSHAAATEAPASAQLQATRAALRKLWRGHAEAVRKVVVAKIANDPAGEKTAEAGVVANAHDIASAISPFYGQAASDKPSRFIRVMILPGALAGKSSIEYLNEDDKAKPKTQSYKIYADAPISFGGHK